MSKLNNPPAFPLPAFSRVEQDGSCAQFGGQPGMTLRDYFAAKAMQALISIDKYQHEQTASESYKYADAMLSEREKQ